MATPTKQSKPSNASGPKSPMPLIIGVVAGVVAVVVVVMVLISVLGSDDTAGSTLPTPTFADGDDVLEFRGVEVIGDALPALADGGGDTAIGTTAPTLKGQTFNGTAVDVVPGDGKPTMLVFLAHWCPHCNSEVPRLLEWYESGGVPADLRVVGVATGTDQNLVNYPPSKWLKDFKWPWEVMADSPSKAAQSAYGLNGYPFMVIIDGDGEVLMRASGEQGSVAAIDQMVDAALASATTTTDPATTEAPTTEAP